MTARNRYREKGVEVYTVRLLVQLVFPSARGSQTSRDERREQIWVAVAVLLVAEHSAHDHGDRERYQKSQNDVVLVTDPVQVRVIAVVLCPETTTAVANVKIPVAVTCRFGGGRGEESESRIDDGSSLLRIILVVDNIFIVL